MELRGARVLITGGTSGIGAALVDHLAQRGAMVVACGRDTERWTAGPGVRNPTAMFVATDLADAGTGRSLVASAVEMLGGLDVVINNAAVQEHLSFVDGHDTTIDDRAAREIAVNLRAPIEISTAAIPYLSAGGPSALVLVTSGLAVFPKKSAPVYCATKSGLRTFAAALRYQIQDARADICVIDAVLPLVDTPMTAGRGTDDEKMSPHDVAARIVNGIERSKPVVFIGKARALPVLLRVAPRLGRRILRNG